MLSDAKTIIEQLFFFNPFNFFWTELPSVAFYSVIRVQILNAEACLISFPCRILTSTLLDCGASNLSFDFLVLLDFFQPWVLCSNKKDNVTSFGVSFPYLSLEHWYFFHELRIFQPFPFISNSISIISIQNVIKILPIPNFSRADTNALSRQNYKYQLKESNTWIA